MTRTLEQIIDEWVSPKFVTPELIKVLGGRRLSTKSLDEVTSGSNEMMLWRCQADARHVWPATVKARVRGSGCPYCAGRLVHETTCLATVRPDLAIQWHGRNDKRPTEVLPGSNELAWWQCPNHAEHVYDMPIVQRVYAAGCPICSGKRVHPTISVAQVEPLLACQWHPKNPKGADQFTRGSAKLVLWLCQFCGHSWKKAVKERNAPYRCPECKRTPELTTQPVSKTPPTKPAPESDRPASGGRTHPYVESNGASASSFKVAIEHCKVFSELPNDWISEPQLAIKAEVSGKKLRNTLRDLTKWKVLERHPSLDPPAYRIAKSADRAAIDEINECIVIRKRQGEL